MHTEVTDEFGGKDKPASNPPADARDKAEY